MNDGLLKKIYENVIIYEDEAVRITHRVDDKVKSLMESYVPRIDEKKKALSICAMAFLILPNLAVSA